MVRREITSDASELIDIAFRDCLGETGAVTNVDIEIRHALPPVNAGDLNANLLIPVL
jgi:hypothetical protein